MPVDPDDQKAMLNGINSCDNTAADTESSTDNASASNISWVDRLDQYLLRDHPLIGIFVLFLISATGTFALFRKG